MSGIGDYGADVAALARKDLRLELRARETLPAMVLFVLVTLVVFHFALPTDASDDAAYGLFWVALVFTALLGLARAWTPERTGGALDGLVLAPCDRSAIWLGKTLAILVFLLAANVVALPAFALLFAPLRASSLAGVLLASIGICAVGSLVSAMAAASERQGDPAAAPVPPARHPTHHRWGRRERLTAPGELPDVPRAVRRRVRDTFVGGLRIRRHRIAATSMSSRLSAPRARLAHRRPVRGDDGAHLRGRADRRRPGNLAEDLLHPRSDRADGLRVLRSRRLEGVSSLGNTRGALRPRELHRRSTRGRSSGR